MRNVSHNMPRRWLFFPIDSGKVNAMAFVLFFNRNTSALIFDAYVAAEHSDPSGLAEYGRNNITYVAGMGSFHHLFAFFTDIPIERDEWREPQMLERYGLGGLLLFTATMPVMGMLFAQTPPPATGAAMSWIFQPLLICGLAYWFDKKA